MKMDSIITERLCLELVTLEDHVFMNRLVNTAGWIEFIGDRNVHSEEDAINYINRILNTPNLYYWVVKTKEDNTPVGIISFLKRAYLEHFDIGFAFLPEYSGKGYAYEAAHEVLAMVSEDPAYAPVLATTVPANTKSIKLLCKLGFLFQKEIEVENQRLLIYSQ